MQDAIFKLGLFGGCLALGLGLFGLGIGTAADATGFQFASIISPVLILLGAALAHRSPRLTAILMLIGIVGIVSAFGLTFLSAAPIGLTAVAMLMALFVAWQDRLRRPPPKPRKRVRRARAG